MKCLILSACNSLERLSLADQKFFVVGMASEVDDSAAIEFSRGFYDAIGAGKSIDYAIDEGTNCAKLKGLAQELPIKILKPT